MSILAALAFTASVMFTSFTTPFLAALPERRPGDELDHPPFMPPLLPPMPRSQYPIVAYGRF